MRFWDLVTVILEKSVHVNSVQANRMIVGMFLKSVKKEHEEQNKACDCCCVQGIRDELRKLVNRSVRITTGSNNYAGTVSSVTCDVVKLANSLWGSYSNYFSL